MPLCLYVLTLQAVAQCDVSDKGMAGITESTIALSVMIGQFIPRRQSVKPTDDLIGH